MIQIENAGISDLQAAMEAQELSCRELVLFYLARIAALDRCAGGLNAIVELNPDALHLADALDSMRRSGTVRSRLHGIPILLKDNISTQDKMHTGAGSAALGNHYATGDSFLVKKLRDAGALILGKTNMTEFANFMADDMPAGYSSRGGYTLNPYDKTATPSGSSSGSAVAVAAGLCAAAVGTETHGSIISPAQHNGIVGIKPTLGLVSRHGVIPISFTLDTAGPMARTVTDAAILLETLAGTDERDPATADTKPVCYTRSLDKNGLSGARIGISRMFLDEADPEKAEALERILPVLTQHGAICTELPPHTLRFGETFGMLMKYEFKCGVNHYLASFGGAGSPKTLQDIILYNQNHAERALKYGQAVLLEAQNNASGTLTEPDYLNALIKREELIRGFDSIFTDHQVDVILSLAGTGLPAMTGFPCMTIPVGQTKNGLPIGSFWMARRYHEKALLRVTYALEQILNARFAPTLS